MGGDKVDNSRSSDATRPRPLFVGRQAELSELGRALDDARLGRPQLVVVTAPAGMGKTALVEKFLQSAVDSCVLRVSGEEAEATLAFGVVSQLAADSTMKPPEALSPATSGVVDPLAVGAALIEWLGELQQSSPTVVLVVDDLHWADVPSMQALTFAFRRLRVDRVMAVIITRDPDDPGLSAGVRRLFARDDILRVALGGLRTDELLELSDGLTPGGLSTRAAARLLAHTDGSPLYARALLEELSIDALEDLGTPLPAPKSYALVVLARLAACSEAVQDLVTSASVLGVRCPLHLAAALARVEDPLPIVDQGVGAGLLVHERATSTLRFPHPLTHAAVYDGLGAAHRADIHRRAATLDLDEPTRLHHRTSATTPPDAALAAELAEFGRRQARDGEWTAAAHHLAAAARLTPSRDDHEQLRLEAIECHLLAGDIAAVLDASAEVSSFVPTAWRSYVLGRLAFVGGRPQETESLLTDAWQRCRPDADPVLAARIAGQLGSVSVLRGRGADVAKWSTLATRLAPGQTTVELIHYLRLLGSGLMGQADAALAELPDLPAPSSASITDLERLMGRGLLRMWTDELAGAESDLAGVLASEHDRSVTLRVSSANLLGQTEYRHGRWDDAIVHHELAISIAEDADQLWILPLLHATAVPVYAGRGDWTRAETHLAGASFGPLASSAAAAMFYRGEGAACLAAARADPEGVIAAVRPIRAHEAGDAPFEPGMSLWQDLLVEALIAVGHHDEARATLEPFEAKAADRSRRSAMAAAARARGTLSAALGDLDGATTAFEDGLEHIAHVEMPFDQARLELAYGSFLRRGGGRRLAATHLEAANEIFERLGATPFVERCHRELAACGLAPGRRPEADFARLTAQELAVARLAASGLTNRQIARELIVSIKTVEYHLGHVYTKLDIRSRVQLAAHLKD
jgi:DNA-binding CsgD family transcriptional regulator